MSIDCISKWGEAIQAGLFWIILVCLERRSNHKQPSVWGFPLSETIQRCHFRCMMLSRKGNGAGRRTRGSNLRICETSAT